MRAERVPYWLDSASIWRINSSDSVMEVLTFMRIAPPHRSEQVNLLCVGIHLSHPGYYHSSPSTKLCQGGCAHHVPCLRKAPASRRRRMWPMASLVPQCCEERPGLLQVSGVKPLGEPAVHLRQQL